MSRPDPHRSTDRAAELQAGLRAVRDRIEAACRRAGRSVDDVELIVVTKTYPASDLALLADLGVTQVGEARVDEAEAKVAELGERAELFTWHDIGQLQTKKASHATRWADVIHSVDREKLIDALDRAADRHGRRVRVLIQVNLDPSPEPGRGGAAAEEVAVLADRVAATEHLELAGVMAVAPREGEPGPAFERLAAVAQQVQASHPEATMISAGMSGDLEEAILAGATHLRVGTAILGSRPPLH